MKEKPKKAEGQTQIAAVLQKHFRENGHPDFVCRRQYIVKWSKPTRNRPYGFPKPDNANRHKVEDCIKWVSENIFKNGIEDDPDGRLQQRAAEAVARLKIRKDEEHKFDFDIKLGKYVLSKDAEIARLGVAKTLLYITREKIRAEFLRDDVARGERLIDQIDIAIEEAAKP